MKSLTSLAFLILFSSTPALAVTVSFSIDKDSDDPFNLGVDKTNNDCSGYFGSGFESCNIAFGGVDISPVIIKFNGDLVLGDDTSADDEDDSGEINSLFSSVDGSEWTFSILGSENNTGTWEYSAGDNDPGIRFWTAKAGPGFNLFWEVDQSEFDSLCNIAVNTLECLMAANPVTSGTWETPDGKGLSHLTFYDSAPTVIPVPAAFWLFGSALIGFIGMSRKTKV